MFEKSQACLQPIALQPWILGLVIFGGTDPETYLTCLNAWVVVGKAPLTCKCCHSPQVAHQLGDGNSDDAINQLILLMDAANEMVCYQLSRHGHDGSSFCVLPKKVVRKPIIVKDSLKHAMALANANPW